MNRIVLPAGCENKVQSMLDDMLAKVNGGIYAADLAKSVEDSLSRRISGDPGREPCHYARIVKAVHAVAESEHRSRNGLR
jgi:hypothetical protein